MGRQVQIYLLPNDIAEFESVLTSRGAIFVKPSSPVAHPIVADTATVHKAEITSINGYIVESSNIEEVSMHAVPEQSNWTVNALQSPVIEFFGCHFAGTTLKRGRLFYDPGFYGIGGEWVEKPKDFETFAKNTFKLARKMFNHNPTLDAYVGPRAHQWQSQINGTLVTPSFSSPTQEK